MKTPLKFADCSIANGQKVYREDGKFSSGDYRKYEKTDIERCLNCQRKKCRGSGGCKQK